MPMLKTLEGYHGTQDIDEYLAFGAKTNNDHLDTMQGYLAGKNGTRALVFGHSEHFTDAQYGWSRIMEATRKEWHKDTMPEWFVARYGSKQEASKHWRDYYQFIISPDPRDHASAKDVAELTRQWCQQNFPDSKGYQWIYSVHADNENGIMHAHVILNAVNASTGEKVQISNGDAIKLARTLQKTAPELGMSQMQDIVAYRNNNWTEYRGVEVSPRVRRDQKTEQAEKISAAERAMVARGARSWIHEIRVAVNKAAAEAKDLYELVLLCEGQGIRVEYTRNGIGFRHPDSTGSDKKALGCTLGAAYTEEGLKARLGVVFSAEAHRWRRPVSTRRPERYEVIGLELRALGIKVSNQATPVSLTEKLDHSQLSRVVPPSKIIDSISTIKKYDIKSKDGLRRAVQKQSTIAANASAQRLDLEATLYQANLAFQAAEEARNARIELSKLPDAPYWDTKTRHRRNELESIIKEKNATAKRILTMASDWAEKRGYSTYSDYDKAIMLRADYQARWDKANAEAQESAEKLQELMGAYKTTQQIANTHSYNGGRKARTNTQNGKQHYYAPSGLGSIFGFNTEDNAARRQYASQVDNNFGPRTYAAATKRQMDYLQSLINNGDISASAAETLGSNPTVKDVNEFLNNQEAAFDLHLNWKQSYNEEQKLHHRKVASQ